MPWSRSALRASWWLGLVVVLLGIPHLGLHLDQKRLEDRFGKTSTRWLDMNAEASVATWFNVGLLQLVVGLAVVAAVAAGTRRDRLAWASLATAVALLSIDEMISVHETLPALLGMSTGTLVTHEWLLPGVAIALVALAALTVLLRPLPRPALLGLLVALVVYGAGAVGVELLSGMAVRGLPIDHPGRLLMPVWEWIEESLEMVGCILALATLLTHLERVGVHDPVRWRRLARLRSASPAAGSPSPRP